MTETPDEEDGSKEPAARQVDLRIDGTISTGQGRSSGLKYWILDTVRVVAGIMVFVSIATTIYVLFYDPLKAEPDAVSGVIQPDGSVTLYITGTKRHDRCPGDWRLIVQRADGSWDSSDPGDTGILPTGALSAVPINVRFARPLSQKLHKATAIVQYYCQLTFRHQFTFTIGPAEAASDADPEGLSWLGPRRACLCPARLGELK